MTPEHPILFSAPMVRDILAGTKTMTRRLIRLPKHPVNGVYFSEDGDDESSKPGWFADDIDDGGECWHHTRIRCPFGAVGSRLWVRETWADADCMYQDHENEAPGVVAYRADLSALQFHGETPRPIPKYDLSSWNWDTLKWRRASQMPRWASRINLKTTAIGPIRIDQDKWEWIAELERTA